MSREEQRDAAEKETSSRRLPLIEAMAKLEGAGISCRGCRGTCCTFEKNSMRISALEADELAAHLRETGRDTEEMRVVLRATIARFGLDRPAPGDGRRVFGRRRYTCPFFSDLGRCTIVPEAKPYGCLAFNARAPGVRDGENCASDQELMREQELASEDEPLDVPRAVLAALER